VKAEEREQKKDDHEIPPNFSLPCNNLGKNKAEREREREREERGVSVC